MHLAANYVPTVGSHVLGSESAPHVIDVKPASTATTLSVSSSTPAIGAQVVYTASVAESIAPALSGPTGKVLFRDGGESIGTCASMPLTVGAGSSTATCTVTYETAGGHTISAEYLGDQNFLVSSSGVASVSVVQPGSLSSEHGAEAKDDGEEEEGATRHRESHLKLLAWTLKLKGEATAANLRCEGDERCEGTVELSAQVSVRVHGKEHRHTVMIGRARYSISAGQKSTIHIELDTAGRAALKQARAI